MLEHVQREEARGAAVGLVVPLEEDEPRTARKVRRPPDRGPRARGLGRPAHAPRRASTADTVPSRIEQSSQKERLSM